MADKHITLTQEFLHELFEYRDGDLFWKISPAKNVKKNSLAGGIGRNGYKRTSINKQGYLIHRIIFLMNKGHLPEFLDHIDGNKLNNKIENLRPATRSENGYNIGARSHGSSGYKNVSWHKGDQTWNVVITVNKKNKHFGSFKNINDAIARAYQVRKEVCKEFCKD